MRVLEGVGVPINFDVGIARSKEVENRRWMGRIDNIEDCTGL